MALPTADEVTAYLRLDTAVEADLIEGILASAKAVATNYLRVPLDSENRTFEGRWPRQGRRREAAEQLTVPVIPCETSGSVTDVDGDEVDSGLYTIDARWGTINLVQGETFDNPPYTVAINVGLGLDPTYNEIVEPQLRQIILHICSDFYNRRNSGAIYEQSGGQVSVTYTSDMIPPVIKLQLDLLRPRQPF